MILGILVRNTITPVAPTLNALTIVSSTEIDLSWTNGSGTNSLKVWRSLDGITFSPLSGTLSGSTTSYADTSVAASTAYWYYVVATSIDGITATSNTVTGTTPAGLFPFDDNLSSYSAGALPLQWGQLDNSVPGHLTAQVVADTSLGGQNTIQGGNTRKQLIWARDNTGTDIQFPADVIVKCPLKPNDSTPSGSGTVGRITVSGGAITQGYGVRIGYHGGATLWKCLSGTWAQLQSVPGPFATGGTAFNCELDIQGSSPVSLKVRCKNLTNGLFLQSDGTEASASNFCIAYSDSTSPITGTGLCGVYGDTFATVAFGEFQVLSAAADVTPPTVSLTSPTNGNTYNVGSAPVTFTATASDNVGGSGMNNVELWADPTVSGGDLVNGTGTLLANVSAPGPYTTSYSGFQNGAHTAVARAFDVAGNHAISSVISFTTTGSTLPTLPTFGGSLPNLTVGGETYGGFSFDADSTYILTYLDWVGDALTTFRALKANLITTYYANICQIYLTVWLDWLNYADAHGVDREAAFYHLIGSATAVSISSGDAFAACMFHQMFLTSNLTDQLGSNNGFQDSAVTFPSTVGDRLLIGHMQRTRSLTFETLTAAAGGWAGVIECVTAVDSNGHPTTFTTRTLNTDGTAGFTATGTQTIDSDPPTGELASNYTGQPNGLIGNGFGTGGAASKYRFYYWSIKCTHAGTPPTATGVRSRDYLGSGFTTSGTAPIYDYASDTGNVGYLTFAQYAGRLAGHDAYFSYEAQAPSSFGLFRVPTNMADPNFSAWAVDYHANRVIPNLIAEGYDPDGIDMDNQSGNLPFPGGITQTNIKESLLNYASNEAVISQKIYNALGTTARGARFLNSNLSKAVQNGNNSSNNAIQFVTHSPCVTYEGTLDPFSDNYQIFLDNQAGIQGVHDAVSPAPIQGIDSAINSWPTALYGSDGFAEWKALIDPQSAYNVLAEAYQVMTAGAVLTFFGQNATNASFAYHWTQACLYDLGKASAVSTQLNSQADPNDGTKTAKTYSRPFGNGLAVFRPLSYSGTSGVFGAGALTISLGASYYLLNVPLVITGTGPGVGGCVRLTVAFSTANQAAGNPTTGITTGQKAIIGFVHGTTEANGTQTVNVIDATHLDLVGTTYVNPFIAPTVGSGNTGGSGSGGLVIWKSQASQNSVSLTNGYGAIFFNSPS